MPLVAAEPLTNLATEILTRSGTPADVAQTVAQSLVLANLKGHDSHGVIRVSHYLNWIERGWIVPAARPEIVSESGSILIVDGHFAFGQLVGREATGWAIPRAKEHGVCVLAIRRSGHLGRLGEFAEMAAEAGLVYLSFTNTHGGGILVAPHGGRERRLSANPIAAAAPLPGGGSMVMDISTSVIAEGKANVARAQGKPLPPGCMVNSAGEPSTDPAEFYADPPGALLPFGGHKGFALSMFAEVLAGALSGAGCSKGVSLVANSLLAIILDPARFSGAPFLEQEIGGLVQHVKSSAPMEGFDEVLIPGEPEQREEERRRQHGIPIDEETWGNLTALAESLGVAAPPTGRGQ
jgi:uncharacterized oxidoreductase